MLIFAAPLTLAKYVPLNSLIRRGALEKEKGVTTRIINILASWRISEP